MRAHRAENYQNKIQPQRHTKNEEAEEATKIQRVLKARNPESPTEFLNSFSKFTVVGLTLGATEWARSMANCQRRQRKDKVANSRRCLYKLTAIQRWIEVSNRRVKGIKGIKDMRERGKTKRVRATTNVTVLHAAELSNRAMLRIAKQIRQI